MAVGCCANFVKYTLFVFNLLIFIGGVALLAAGVWVAVDTSGATATLASFLGSSSYATAAYVLIVCGAVILILGFLGCCGAIRESRCLLGTFFALVLLIFLVLLVGAILAFVFKDTVTSFLKTSMEQSLKEKYGVAGEQGSTDAWNAAQENFQCCGLAGDYKSGESWLMWKDSTWGKMQVANSTGVMVPASCCMKSNTTTYTDEMKCQGKTVVAGAPPTANPPTADNPDMYTQGCYDRVGDIISGNSVLLGIIAIMILIVLLMAMIFSMWLCRRVTYATYTQTSTTRSA
ncbi:tetraspanin-18B-like [Lineus longissimus]|uniref:tetraspanin-18B-like n=1 Tax=Lineus longissimus TaxID=88925 RepID=UPI002B4D5160